MSREPVTLYLLTTSTRTTYEHTTKRIYCKQRILILILLILHTNCRVYTVNILTILVLVLSILVRTTRSILSTVMYAILYCTTSIVFTYYLIKLGIGGKGICDVLV